MNLRRILAWSTIVTLLLGLGVVTGMAFPQSLLGNKVEIYYSGAWHDISSDVRGIGAEDGEINISQRGMPDESSGLVTTLANLSINNRLGKYSFRNVRSALYGLIGPNTPIRISTDVSATASVIDSFDTNGTDGWPTSDSGHEYTETGGAIADYFVSAGVATMQHTAVNTSHLVNLSSLLISDFDITVQGIDLEAQPTGSDAAVFVYGRYSASPNTHVRSRFTFTPGGNIQLVIAQVISGATTNLTGFINVPGVTSADNLSVRMQAVGRTLRVRAWEFGTTEPTTWLSTVTTTLITPGSIAISTLLNSGVTNALPFDFSFDSLDFSLGIIIFMGEVVEWPKKWDLTGSDVWVPLQASGLTRRKVQGAKPLRSALYRALIRTDLVGYWDFENLTATDYETIPSALANGQPLRKMNDFPARNLTSWNGNTSLIGSGALPSNESAEQTGGSLRYGQAPLLTADTANNAFSVVYWSNVPLRQDAADPFAGYSVNISIANSPQIARWSFSHSMQDVGTDLVAFTVFGYDATGSAVVSNTGNTAAFVDGWRMIRYTVDQNAGNIRMRIYLDEVLVTTSTVASVTTGQPLAIISTSASASNPGITNSWGHLAIASGVGTDPLVDNIAHIQDASLAHNGESVIDRMTRIFAEEDTTLVITQGTVANGEGTLCGPQKPLTFIDLAVATARADDGILYELRDQLGYGFKTRASLYGAASQLTVDYALFELSEVPETTDDDQRIRNEVTATRDDSNTSVTVSQTTGPMSVNEPTASPPGVGRYETEVKSPLYSDDQLLDYAGFRLMLGTWDESRWPGISVAMHRTPFSGNLTQLTSAAFLDIADIFTLVNLPVWLPPDNVVLQMRSVSIFLSNFQWGINWNTLPGAPWAEIGTIGDGSYGRLETSGSSLVTAIGAADTDLIVLTAESDLPLSIPYWTEDINELNYFDEEGLRLRLNPAARAGGRGGEQITVGATFVATDTFTRTASQLAGTMADSGQTWGTAQGTATDATVDGTRAVFTHPAANTVLGVQLPIGSTDLCTSVDATFSVTTATGAALRAMVYVRTDTVGTNAYHARLELIGSVVTLRLVKTIASVSTAIGTLATMSAANSNSVAWRIKVMVQNRNLYAKAWRPSVDTEPDWQVNAFDGANEYMIATRTALYSERVTGNTDANATIRFDNLTVQSRKITAAYYDRWSRTETDTLGTSDSGGAWTLLQNGGTAADYDVAPNRATTVIGAANTYRAAYLDDIDLRDASASVIWTCPLATGADLYAGNLLLRGTSTTSYVLCRVYMVPVTNTINIEIVAADGSSLGVKPVPGLTHVAATEYRTRAAAIDDQIMMKVWIASQPEPHYWQLVVTDPAAVVSGWVGWFNGRQSGNTNVNPTPTIADFRVDNPQRITAGRGANGVATSWIAGTDVRLWNPLRLAR